MILWLSHFMYDQVSWFAVHETREKALVNVASVFEVEHLNVDSSEFWKAIDDALENDPAWGNFDLVCLDTVNVRIIDVEASRPC